MLILCSNGLSSDELLNEVKNKIAGTTAALVVTGDLISSPSFIKKQSEI